MWFSALSTAVINFGDCRDQFLQIMCLVGHSQKEIQVVRAKVTHYAGAQRTIGDFVIILENARRFFSSART